MENRADIITRLQTGKVKTQVRVTTRSRGFSLLQRAQTGPGANLAYYSRVPETLTPGVKPPKSKAEQLPPSGPEAKNESSHASTSTYAFTAHTRTTFLYIQVLIEVPLIFFTEVFSILT